MPQIPISYPARYAPGMALAFADAAGAAVQVSGSSPLPVTLAAAGGSTASAPAALAGSTATALTAGPFAPVAGRPIVLTLSGTWTGSVQLLRSVNSGATKLALTLAGQPWGRYTANVCEPVWEEQEAAATFYLQLTPASGTIAYRMAQ